MNCFLDVYALSLNKYGEELCGDQVKFIKANNKTCIVLSDGMGSGVKANILATLTSEIIITMVKEDIALKEVLETVVGTLPTCKERGIAYATFTVVEIDHKTYKFKVLNFDNPPVFFFKQREVFRPETRTITVMGKEITVSEGQLQEGDFLAAISDGLWYAGPGNSYNHNWGWEHIAHYMELLLTEGARVAQTVVESVIGQTRRLYGDHPRDDASLVGAYLRRRNSAMVFTGPPLDKEDDSRYVEKLMAFEGRKVVCGGTTGNIVARVLGKEIVTVASTVHQDLPPIGRIKGIHLLTEGILTITKAIEYVRDSGGDLGALPNETNSAVLLALELLYADEVYFLVGQQINPFYQNPILPSSVSIRRNAIEQLAELLRGMHKDITVEYC